MKKCYIEKDHSKMGEKIEYCVLCNKKIGKSYKERLEDKVKLVDIKDKQKLLDLLHEGKTIGEAREEVGLELDVVGEIIVQNIGEINYLNKKAI